MTADNLAFKLLNVIFQSCCLYHIFKLKIYSCDLNNTLSNCCSQSKAFDHSYSWPLSQLLCHGCHGNLWCTLASKAPEAFLIHTHNDYTYRKLQYLKLYDCQNLMIPIKSLLHLVYTGYSCCCHFYLVFVLPIHCHCMSIGHSSSSSTVLQVSTLLPLALSNRRLEDPNEIMYEKSLIPSPCTKKCLWEHCN